MRSALQSELHAPRPQREIAIHAVLAACGWLSVATTVGIVAVLLTEALQFFGEVGLVAFLADTQWTPLFAEKHFGIWPLLAGTALTTAIAAAVAVPAGLLAAIYLSEFAPRQLRQWLKPALELLAAVPTVIYGYFALTIVTPLLQNLLPNVAPFNALSAGLVMGVMILPVVGSLSEDALFAVPNDLRQAAWALGAGKLRTTWMVVLPAARSGVAAALMLAVARAIGETMIVAIAAGQQANFTADPRGAVETMTAYIVQVSLGDTPAGTLEYRTIFAVGLALFLSTMLLNGAAFALRRRMGARA